MTKAAILDPLTNVVIGETSGTNTLDVIASASLAGKPVIVPDDMLLRPMEQAQAADGSFYDLPPQPDPRFVWTGTAWVDPRTQAEIDAEAAASLHARRAVASLSKLEFAKRVSHPETGVIQPSSGMALLAGSVPPELDGMVNALPPADQFALIMDLLGATQFDRLNPFVVAAGQYLGMTDAQMDAVFGI